MRTAFVLACIVAVVCATMASAALTATARNKKQKANADTSGVTHWQMGFGTKSHLLVPPVYVEDTDLVVFIDSNATITCVNTTALTVQWSRSTGRFDIVHGSTQLIPYTGLSQCSVFVNVRGNWSSWDSANETSLLVAFDAVTGEERWARDLPNMNVVLAYERDGGRTLVGASVTEGQVEVLGLHVDDGSVSGLWMVGFTGASSVTTTLAAGGVAVTTPAGTTWFVDIPSGSVVDKTSAPLVAASSNYAVTAERSSQRGDSWHVALISGNSRTTFDVPGERFTAHFTQPVRRTVNAYDSTTTLVFTDHTTSVIGWVLPPPPKTDPGEWTLNVDVSTNIVIIPCKTVVVLVHSIYDGAGLNLTTVDARTGRVLWSAAMDEYLEPVFRAAGDMLVVSSGVELVVFDGRTGARETLYEGLFDGAVGPGLSGTYAFVRPYPHLELTLLGFSAHRSAHN